MVENLGVEFQDVVISELKDHTYYARLRVRTTASWWRSTPAPPTPSPWRSLHPVLPIFVNEDVLHDVLEEQ